MVDITTKANSLRKAVAQAIVKVSRKKTIDAILQKQVPKGDVFEMAKVAGLFGVKKTSDLIPDCHPLPIEYTKVSYEVNELEISINLECATIYKTGVEVEAMHGASLVALTIYDMLKPIDKGVEIGSIKLLSKTGGKSQYKNKDYSFLKAGVIVISDSVSEGTSTDTSGTLIVDNLQNKFQISVLNSLTVPDNIENIRKALAELKMLGCDVIITTGGTGLGPRDVTPEAIKPLLDTEIDGIMEVARNYGQERIPYAMLSRGIAGISDRSLVLTFPGSPNAVTEYMDALFPYVFHVFFAMQGKKHN